MRGYEGPGRYVHYKGDQYEVLGLAIREETIGSDDEVTEVVYRPLKKYDREEEFVTRVLEDFNKVVEIEGGKVYRFIRSHDSA